MSMQALDMAVLILANAILLAVNVLIFLMNINRAWKLEQAKAQLPRIVRPGDDIEVRAGERIAVEIIVPQPPHPEHGEVPTR